jgi:predicted permease
VTPGTWIDQRATELRYALRMIRKTPGASAIAVLSLALGIGANTAIFSLVDAMLLKLLPVRAPQELHQVARNMRGRPSVSWDYPDYCAFRDRNHSFTGLVATSSPGPLGLQMADFRADATELVYASHVSGNCFDVLGVEPALGHLLNAQDDRTPGASPYAVLSYDYWQRRFAADPHVVGRTVRLNGYPFTIVGVARRGFRGLDVTASPNLFVPITMRGQTGGLAVGVWNSRHFWWLQVTGRLAPGATPAQATAQLTAIYRAQEEAERQADPRAGLSNAGQAMLLMPASRGWSGVRNTMEKPLLVLMVVVGVVLLIACANVASLMLARGVARQREIAIRLAVGATRVRLAGQLLVESLALSLLGGLLGLVFAYLCVQMLLGFVPRMGSGQVDLHVSPDLRLLAFAFGVSVLTGVLFGIAPALQSTRPDLVPALKDDVLGDRAWRGRRRSRLTLRKALVVAQVALSLLLLVGAGLFVRTLQNLRDLDTGFRRDRTVLATIDPGRNGYKGQRLRDFYEQLRARVQRLPGVRSASLASITPLGGMQWNGDFRPEGYTFKAGEQKWVEFNSVSPRYFETVGIPMMLGRDFRDLDNPAYTLDPPAELRRGPEPDLPGPHVTIVSESFAKRFFEGRNPIGMHVCLQEEYDPARAYEVVGVVKDARYFGMREAVEPMIYVPAWRPGPESKVLCIRTARDDGAVVADVRREVTAIDAAVPVLASRTMREQIDEDIVVERLIATLSGFFGLLALLLAGVGLYGVIAHTVSRRTREIGIRMALGAQRSSVLWLVLRDAALLVAGGAAVGIPAALVLTRLVRTFLYGVGAQDFFTLAAGVVMLVVVAAVASLVPARRATSIEPNTALRCE